MIILLNQRVDIVLGLALSLVGFSILYGMTMLAMSRKEPTPQTSALSPIPGPGFVVSTKEVIFVLPCLNEERVIAASLDRLVQLQYPKMHVLVVDDGSEDATASLVREHPDPRVSLLLRTLPEARKGKGEALNAAIRHITTGAVASYTDANDVIICVVDADGRLESHVLDEVLPLFAEPRLGGVQIGVRINNRDRNLLARMQDIEFVLYTEVFQRGRRHLGSVCLGGNGQFVRLSALSGLGSLPWSRSLSEDLDLGIRLLLQGWRLDFCPTVSVHQQGLVHFRRWARQRTRWFQGHLQSWTLVPWVLRDLSGSRRVDLLYHLTSPYLLLVTSFLSAAFILWIAAVCIGVVTGTAGISGWWLLAYLFAFGPALVFGRIYWQKERNSGLSRLSAVLLLHLYVGYCVMWYVAGWRAAFRSMSGNNSWAKTDRTTDDQQAVMAPQNSATGFPKAPGAA